MFGLGKKKQSTEEKHLNWWDALTPLIETTAGINVSGETAMQSPAVRACVTAIAEGVGQLPLHLYQRETSGGRSIAEGNPIYRLLNTQPNSWTTSQQLRERVTIDALLYGRGYVWINRDRNGEPVELHHLPHGTVSRDQKYSTQPPMYKISGHENTQSDLVYSDVLEIGAAGGRSPVLDCKNAIALSIACERYLSLLMKRGGRPAGVLSVPANTMKEAFDKIKAQFVAMNSGESSAGVAVVPDGSEYTQTDFRTVDMEFSEMRKAQTAEIARSFRVPLPLIGTMDHATMNNVEALGRQFLTYTVTPMLERWENAINSRLLPAGSNLFAQHNTDEFQRADMQARGDYYSKMITNGVMAPNEARSRENLAPYAGGEVFLTPMNMRQSDETS